MSPYQQFIDALSEEALQQIIRGETGIGCNETGYCLEVSGAQPLELSHPGKQAREALLEMEPQVLEQLYRQRPLCHAEFDYQAARLLAAHPAARFCRHGGNPDNWALMIDDWQLIAVGPDDVRSQYGYFCEAQEPLDETQASTRVTAWLNSGEAYEDYRAKTHCRYCL